MVRKNLEINELLQNIENEDSRRKLFALIYQELKHRAKKLLARHHNPALGATALVHEAYLKLACASLTPISTEQFFGLAARAMRQVVVDHARYNLYQKRDERLRVSFSEDLELEAPSPVDLIELDRALDRLGERDQNLVEIVQLHFFGGLGFAEIADIKKVSLSTIERMWRDARALLREYV